MISAVFANFRQKIGAFLKNQCYGNFFAKTMSSLMKKAIFSANIFLKSKQRSQIKFWHKIAVISKHELKMAIFL
jgi:hypothetical protein